MQTQAINYVHVLVVRAEFVMKRCGSYSHCEIGLSWIVNYLEVSVNTCKVAKQLLIVKDRYSLINHLCIQNGIIDPLL